MMFALCLLVYFLFFVKVKPAAAVNFDPLETDQAKRIWIICSNMGATKHSNSFNPERAGKMSALVFFCEPAIMCLVAWFSELQAESPSEHQFRSGYL